MNIWDYVILIAIFWFFFQNLDVSVNVTKEEDEYPDKDSATDGWLFLDGIIVHKTSVRYITPDAEDNAVVHLYHNMAGDRVEFKTKTPFSEVYESFE